MIERIAQAALLAGIGIVGTVALLPYRRSMPVTVRGGLAFPVGALLLALCGCVLAVTGAPITLGALMAGAAALAVVCWAPVGRPRHLTSGDGWIVAGVLGWGLLSASLDLSVLSYDSFYLHLVARSLADHQGVAPQVWESFGIYGPFQYILLSTGPLAGLGDLRGVSLMWGGSFLLLLYGLTRTVACGLTGNERAGRASGIFACALAVSSYFIVWQFVYVHTNLPAGVYLLIWLGSWLLYRNQTWHDGDPAVPGRMPWLWLCAVGALGFTGQRAETPLVAAAILFVLSTDAEARRRDDLTMAIPVALFTVGWYAAVLYHLPEPTRILTPPLIAALMVAVVGAVLWPWLRDGGFARWPRPRAQQAAVYGLTFVLLLMFAIKPEHMATSLSFFLSNLFATNWGFLWPGLLALAILSRRLPPVSEVATVERALFALVLLVLCMAYFRLPYRPSWGDSANRMMVHVVPTLILILSTRLSRTYGYRGAAATP